MELKSKGQYLRLLLFPQNVSRREPNDAIDSDADTVISFNMQNSNDSRRELLASTYGPLSKRLERQKFAMFENKLINKYERLSKWEAR